MIPEGNVFAARIVLQVGRPVPPGDTEDTNTQPGTVIIRKARAKTMNVKDVKKLLAPAALLGATLLAGAAHAQAPQYRAPYDGGNGGRVFQGARPNFGQNFERAGGGVRWEGDVDDTTIVYVHRRDVRTDTVAGHSASHVNVHQFGGLPDRPVSVFLRHEDGRGHVRIVQQPGPDNDWTAAVRLHDPQPGRSHYEFELGWQGDGGGQAYDGREFRGARGY